MNGQDIASPGRREWTEKDLDSALHHVQFIAAPAEPQLAAAGTALLRAVGELTPKTAGVGSLRRWRRPVLIAAAAAVLVAGGLIIPSLRWGGRPVNSAVAQEFNQAADAAARTAAAGGGGGTPAGQYRYIDIDAWYAQLGSYTFLQQSRQQIWVPAVGATPGRSGAAPPGNVNGSTDPRRTPSPTANPKTTWPAPTPT